MTMVIRTCQQCGKEYRTHHTTRLKYCSSRCFGLAHQKGTIEQCAQCGKDFYRHRSKPDRRFCSISCAMTARNLTDENPAYHHDISGQNNPMFGRGMSGTENPMYGKRKDQAPRWTGGERTRKDGYAFVVAPDDHPYPSYTKPSGTKYILKHRWIMEQFLGRYLSPDEVVHHIDGDPTNNDIRNLRLFDDQSAHISNGHN